MLEGTWPGLAAPGGPHHVCPDKKVDVRLDTLEAAGQAGVPFTSGVLIGLGEGRRDRVTALVESKLGLCYTCFLKLLCCTHYCEVFGISEEAIDFIFSGK